MKCYWFCVLSILLFNFSGTAQRDTLCSATAGTRSLLTKQIVPLSLITAGSLLNIGTIKKDIHEFLPRTDTQIDDYLQFMPMVQMYLLDAAGISHRNTVWDQTKYLALSQLFSGSLVHLLKNTTQVTRPWGGDISFPSGHTAIAFTGATVLYHEFRESEPLLAWSGYVFATATGLLRVTNNAHWLPDVMAGAGIAILTTNLVYHFEPLSNFQPFKKRKNLTFVPMVTPETIGFQCRF